MTIARDNWNARDLNLEHSRCYFIQLFTLYDHQFKDKAAAYFNFVPFVFTLLIKGPTSILYDSH